MPPTVATFNTKPPERIYEVDGDIHTPLRRLRARHLAKADWLVVFATDVEIGFHVNAALNIGAFLPEENA